MLLRLPRRWRFLLLLPALSLAAWSGWQWKNRDNRGYLPPRSNVVLIVIDALRSDHLGCYGYPRATSPYLDSLARRGTLCRQAYCNATWTKPSFTSLLTSLHPRQHGVDLPESVLGWQPATLAQVLQHHGYYTGAIIGNGNVNRNVVPFAGFTTYQYPLDDPAFCTSPLRLLTGGSQFVMAEEITRDAINWLEARPAGQPFFLTLFYLDPHSPSVPREPYASMFATGAHSRVPDGKLRSQYPELSAEEIAYEIGRYDGDIRYCDDQLARFGAYLAARGLLGSTLMVITADHGEDLFERGYAGHGQNVFRETLQVPLLFIPPLGQQSWRPEVTGAVQSIDVAPTILDVLRLPVPEGFAGRSLRRALYFGDAGDSPVFFETRKGNVYGGMWHGKKLVYDESGDTCWEIRQEDALETVYRTEAGDRSLAAAIRDWRMLPARVGRQDTGITMAGVSAQLRALGYLQ